MREMNILKRIMIEASKLKHNILFRINVGQAWTGDKFIKLQNGDLLIKNPRPFKTGVPNGFPDLFGISSVKVTKKMVGQRIGVFTAIEVKGPRGKVTSSQERFIKMVYEMKGIAGVARSSDDLEKILGIS